MAIRDNIVNLFKTNKKIKNNMDLLNSNLKDIYSTVYSDPMDNLTSAQDIRDNIDTHIDKIMSNTYSNASIGNLNKLYTKLLLQNAQNDKDIEEALKDTFNDQALSSNILSTWIENKWVKDFDCELDMVLKYVPKLREAMSCKKDLILSADHFSKDFVSYHNIQSSGKEELFNSRMNELKRTYKLAELYDKWLDDAQIYGEVFVYVAPYNREFEKLLKSKQDFVTQTIGETTIINEGSVNLSLFDDAEAREFFESTMGKDIGDFKNLTVTFNGSGILQEAAKEISNMRILEEQNKFSGLKGMYLNEVYTEAENKVTKRDKEKIADSLIPDDLEFKDEDYSTASEMIIGGNDKKESKEKINIPGCIVKQLDRGNVIPIYVGEVCLGYYYLEFNNNELTFDDPNTFEYASTINTIGGSGRMSKNVEKMQQQNRDKMIGYLAQQLSTTIDAKFINNNQDIRKELFAILKHCELFNNPNNVVNGNICINFLSAEDVTHIYFNQDPVTKRGVSDLAYSLFPAKLYSCMYITNVLGQITRGQDKRVYYVKQNVETNISKTLLNVLNQIKKGNFGVRQMENLSNILNITGRFNDYLIPLSPSGDQPITFDILPGQQFTDNSELMNALEKMAIDPTGIPYDLIEARQSLDYAIQATMSNSKLMRMTYKRQDAYEAFITDITSKIYNYEYNEYEIIETSLPAPAFLNMTNGSQLINGTSDYINTLIQTELSDEEEPVQNEFRKIALRYYIPSHINIPMINKMKIQAKMNVAKKQNQQEEEEQ